MTTALEALARLREGNQEFASSIGDCGVLISRSRWAELIGGQNPFAIILGCSDSRVPAEIVFNQGLGDLFVIRVAGNIAAPSQIGSVEYAAAHLGARLVVVLGHTQCGAIAAMLSELQQPAKGHSPHLLAIIDCIRPAVAPLLQTELRHDPKALAEQAGRANVRASVQSLRRESQILKHLAQSDGLRVIGAEYSLESGHVEFFDTGEDEFFDTGEDESTP